MHLVCQLYLLHKAQFSLCNLICCLGTGSINGRAFFCGDLKKSETIGGGTCEVTNTADPI